jgi:hypothetical protein
MGIGQYSPCCQNKAAGTLVGEIPAAGGSGPEINTAG